MDRKDVAYALNEVGTLLDLLGEEPFRSKVYAKAARAVESLEDKLEVLIRRNQLIKVKGIGQGIAAQIKELLETGEMAYLEELKAQVPGDLIEMLSIRGLGPKKLRRLHLELGVETLGELEYACLENRLVDLKGFGDKSQQSILQGIAALNANRGRFLLSTAAAIADALQEAIAENDAVQRVAIAGEVRRSLLTVWSVDLVVATQDPQSLARFLDERDELEREEDTAPPADAWLGRHTSGPPVKIFFCQPEHFGTALWQRTGSESHCADLLKLCGGDIGVHADENALYASTHCEYVEPELREGGNEIEAARQDRLPELISAADVRGLIHNHTTYSDGADSLEEMARAVAEQGYAYFGVADHSQSAVYARGLSPERLDEQRAEIEALDLPITVLQGVESDILRDGSLDYDDAVLERLDYVVASVHGLFRLDRGEQTRRLVRAVSHPLCDILGHPTGRLLLSREPYEVDLDAVLEAAAEHGVAIELNANPHRLDLDWRKIRRAMELGLMIAINPDAHRVAGLDHVHFGVAAARKGWLTRDHLLNALSADEFREWIAARRARRR